MRRSRKVILVAATAAILLALFTLWCNLAIDYSARKDIYISTELVPYNAAAVVLGCPVTTNGRPNKVYINRIDAAVRLYHSGRTSHLIVSGFPAGQTYAMKRDLTARGIPNGSITQDSGGYRTLASIIRARDIFGLESFTVVTQPRHASRALYLARAHGIDAVAFAADDPRCAKVSIREYFAQVKAVLDVHLLHRNARASGEKTPILSPPDPNLKSLQGAEYAPTE